MHTALPPSLPGPSEATGARQQRSTSPSRRVVDAPTRMLHALIALSFAGAYLSAEGERWRALHISLGYLLGGLLLARIAYGLAGPRQARVMLWFRKLAAAPAWLRASAGALASGSWTAVGWRQGQNLVMAGLIALLRQGQNLVMAGLIALLPLLLVPLLLSGLAPHLEWVQGGLADAVSELHEALGEATLGVVLAHIGAVVALSLIRRQNQARPMLSGRVPGVGPDLASRNRGLLALLILAAAAGFLAWRVQATPQGLWPSGPRAESNDPEGRTVGTAQRRHDRDDDDD